MLKQQERPENNATIQVFAEIGQRLMKNEFPDIHPLLRGIPLSEQVWDKVKTILEGVAIQEILLEMQAKVLRTLALETESKLLNTTEKHSLDALPGSMELPTRETITDRLSEMQKMALHMQRVEKFRGVAGTSDMHMLVQGNKTTNGIYFDPKHFLVGQIGPDGSVSDSMTQNRMIEGLQLSPSQELPFVDKNGDVVMPMIDTKGHLTLLMGVRISLEEDNSEGRKGFAMLLTPSHKIQKSGVIGDEIQWYIINGKNETSRAIIGSKKLLIGSHIQHQVIEGTDVFIYTNTATGSLSKRIMTIPDLENAEVSIQGQGIIDSETEHQFVLKPGGGKITVTVAGISEDIEPDIEVLQPGLIPYLKAHWNPEKYGRFVLSKSKLVKVLQEKARVKKK